MFTIKCTTCNAKLAVRNDELIGQILACPKCGGMVLVSRPGEEGAVPQEAPKPFVQFPDALTSGTDSGVINVGMSDESVILNVEKLAEEKEDEPTKPPVPPIELKETEIKTRRIMLYLLFGLVTLLVLSVGLLIALKGNQRSFETEQIIEEPEVESVVESEEPDEDETDAVEEEEEEAATEPAKEVTTVDNTPADTTNEQNQPKPAPSEAPVQPEVPVQPAASVQPAESATTPLESPETPDFAQLLALKSAEELTASETDSTQPTQPEDHLAALEQKFPALADSSQLPVDLTERLQLRLGSLESKDTYLVDFLLTLSMMTDIPISFDVDEYRCRGIELKRPVKTQQKNVTVEQALEAVLKPLGLVALQRQNQLSITVPPDQKDEFIERKLLVSDLVQGSKTSKQPFTAEGLMNAIKSLVDPIGLSQNQPDGPFIRVENGEVLMKHHLKHLDDAQRILEQLRVLRKMAQLSSLEGEYLVPETFGWDKLTEPMTLNYYQMLPLGTILARIEEKTGMTILVDHQSLNRALTPFHSIKATVRCDNGTVNEVLEKLLDSVHSTPLEYRIIDHQILEITVRDVALSREKMTIEVHQFGSTDSPEELVRTIRTALSPESWYDPENPESLGGASVFIDSVSSCFLVRQSQPVQRQLRLWLNAKAEPSAPEPELTPDP